MALARKREWYFEASYVWSFVWAVLTLGTWPLLLQSYRFDRFRRLEWNQYHALAQWMSRVVEHPIASDLEGFAEKAAGRPASRVVLKAFVLGALAIAALAFFRTSDLLILVKTVFYPQSMLWPAIAFSAVLSVAWLVHLLAVLRQQAMTTAWIGRLNELLVAQEKRPVAIRIARPAWPWIAGASAIVVLGPTWAAVALMAMAVQNRYVASTRPARLALLERMLEWMDTSGLPVEFDIEEVEPDELVTLA